MKLRAARLLSARRRFSSAPPPPVTPSGRARRLFEIPEDPPELKAFKDRESRLIKDQLGRSKFLDAQRATGVDKRFVAAPELLAASADERFPHAMFESVTGGAPVAADDIFAGARATIVTLAFQGLGQSQLRPWHAAITKSLAPPAASAAGPSRSVQLANVLFLEGWFWKLARGIIAQTTANALPPGPLRDATFLTVCPSSRDTDHWCDAARVHNRMMAHVMIVDSAGRVRWRAHGALAHGEQDSLASAALSLAQVR